MEIIRANKSHIDQVARLFDLYRQFYLCEPDMDLATQFIGQRMANNESVIFIAQEAGVVKGFVQLYPSFCSVDAVKIFILYDLYVDSVGRNAGLGALLMDQAAAFAQAQGAARLDLLTAFDNAPGIHLYEKLGYKLTNQSFHAYSLALDNKT